MFPCDLFNRISLIWWDGDDEDYEEWPGHLSRLLGWPFPLTIDNSEIWDGGGA